MSRDAGAEQLRSACVAAESNNATALADLRCRVARSDAAINSLAADNRERENRIRRGAQEEDNKWHRVERRMQKLDDHVRYYFHIYINLSSSVYSMHSIYFVYSIIHVRNFYVLSIIFLI